MKLNKKGFTLVELLAVIVVLSIIALIGYTVIGDTISNAQYGADARSLESYVNALESKCMELKVLSPTDTTAYTMDKVKSKVDESFKGTKPSNTANLVFGTGDKECTVASTAEGKTVDFAKSKCTYDATTGSAECKKN